MVYYYVVGYNMMYVDVGNFIGSIAQETELAAARAQGFSAEAIAALESVQALEAATAARQREIEVLRQQRAFSLDLSAREAALMGDDRRALELELQAQTEAELNRSQELLDAGTITATMFERLKDVLVGEVNQALAGFDSNLVQSGAVDTAATTRRLREASAQVADSGPRTTTSSIVGASELTTARLIDVNRSQLFVLQDIARSNRVIAQGAARAGVATADPNRTRGLENRRERGRQGDARV